MLEDQTESRDSAAGAAAPDRRTGKRHSLVLLIGKVCRGTTESACLVHNISQFGLMARFTTPPTVGEALRIEVRGLPPIAGTVRWVRGTKAGFAFDVAQDIDHVFRLKQADGMIARSPRFPIAAVARLRFEAEPFSAELIDISPGGAKLTSETPVKTGLTGQILLPDTGTSIYGAVCWTRDDRFGFRFVAPLPLATLAQILGC